MSAAIHVDVARTVAADLLRLEEGLGRGTTLRQQIGGNLQRVTQDALSRKDATPNRLGGIRTNFYGKAAQSTFFSLTGDGIVVTISKEGIRQRIEGGVIRPVNTTWLAIPVVPEAHGKRPREFGNLKFIPIHEALALLVAKAGGQDGRRAVEKNGKRRNVKSQVDAGETMFVLKKKVTQAGEADILPSDQAYDQAISGAVDDWLATIGGRN